MTKTGQVVRSISALVRGEATLRQIRDMWEVLYGPTTGSIIVYGPYDAIWPTTGQEDFSWFCEGCGLSNPDPEYGTLADARLGASDHRTARHPDADFVLVEVDLDPEETH
jgi:hypothetical protein